MPAKPKRPGDRRKADRRKKTVDVGEVKGLAIFKRKGPWGRLTSNTRLGERRTGPVERRTGKFDRRVRDQPTSPFGTLVARRINEAEFRKQDRFFRKITEADFWGLSLRDKRRFEAGEPLYLIGEKRLHGSKRRRKTDK